MLDQSLAARLLRAAADACQLLEHLSLTLCDPDFLDVGGHLGPVCGALPCLSPYRLLIFLQELYGKAFCAGILRRVPVLVLCHFELAQLAA